MPDTPQIGDSDSADPKDIMNTVFLIEQMFRCANELPVPLKYHDCFIGCMAILQKNHDDLVKKLPKEVLEVARTGGLVNGQTANGH